jgi:endonuclease YncB( thermonuclease family)
LDAVGSEKHGWGSRHNIDPKAYWFKDTPMRHFKPNYAFATVALSVALSSSAFAAAPVVKSGQTFMCTPTHVWDGDGPIWCEQGPRIRLAGIAAREMDGTCKPFHPCPDAAAEDARDALVSLVGLRIGVGQHGHILVTGPPMRCISDGPDRHNRTVAWCVSPKGGDINCKMVLGGWALRWTRYWNQHICS